MKKTVLILFALCLTLMVASFAFGQSMPAPGTVIDKNNYKQYVHLFPPEFAGGFESGFDGLYKPWVVKVVEGKPVGQPKPIVELSEKNRGKYGIDANGFISGGYDFVGIPFPGVTPSDKDFAVKFMYNYAYRYYFENYIGKAYDIEKRRGENLTNVMFDTTIISFINRFIDNPKPTFKNPAGLQTSQTFFYTYPPSWKTQQMLSYRYLDSRKSDEVYLYLPTMRRVLRTDASQRSTPIQGTTQAFDDFNGFDGKTQDFNFKFLAEEKILACSNTKITTADFKKMQAEGGGFLPFPGDDWSVRDVYVIEAASKNSKYPQSKKIIYIDKESLQVYHAVAFDRAGKLWKVWSVIGREFSSPSGDKFYQASIPLGVDVQIGFATSFLVADRHEKPYGNGLKYTDMLPSIMSKRGQ